MKFILLTLFAVAILASPIDDLGIGLHYGMPKIANGHKPIPVMEEFCHGMDGTTGELKDQIIDPSWNSHHTFVAGYLAEKPTFDVPDELTVTANSQSTTDIGTTFYDTFEEYASHEHASGVVVHNGTAHKAEADVIKNKLKSGHYFLSYNKADWYLFNSRHCASILLALRYLNPDFKQMVTSLPATVSDAEDQALYNKLVERYGSNLLSGGQFGVGVHMDVFVNKTFVSKKGKSFVDAQVAKLYHKIFFKINPGPYNSSDSIKIDESFTNHTETSVFFIGGDPKLQHIETVDKWFATAFRFPALLHHQQTVTLDQVVSGAPKHPIKATIAYYLKNKKLPVDPVQA